MFVSSNLLRDLLPYFKRKLKSVYEEEEIESIFFRITEDTLNLTKRKVLTEDKRLTESELLTFKEYVDHLAKNEPLQYILGEADFLGLKFKVSPAVLIPRPETEELVDLIIRENKTKSELEILDIGCGSGCIPISLKKNIPQSKVTAMDISSAALEIAKINSVINKTEITFLERDLFSDSVLEMQQFDIIVSNPPYIADSEREGMHANVKEHEPAIALFVPDSDPLKFYNRIFYFAQTNLKPDGLIYFEINPYFADELTKIALQNKFSSAIVLTDLSGKNRFLKVTK
ncbi:MAG: peptide chain release factor N(5)-glutamine methyltransferase [Crocinitomicaceae bacterium]|jgi:release factor glutamine methyltransferase|nr:peptide chain release factor N(5)-glutamine methyltransferase [Crocinitomicaceae bacterium]MBK6952099.1 peptide chain release factor N(5)-glutamine methyltransferase [Crocinitomicaceae bacterium]MBK9591287.1 peptide chain release factor N(5)-glutamine methyltransferase [Crocinitomicaceae bacterium]